MDKDFRNSVASGNTRVVSNPLSDHIMILSRSGDLRFALGVAAQYLKDPAFAKFKLSVTCDSGSPSTFEVHGKTQDLSRLTAVDLYIGLWNNRCRMAPSNNSFDVLKEESGKITADFKKDDYLKYQDIYFATLDAVLLSREHGGKTVEFEFRGKTIGVNGDTRPEDIDALFPDAEKARNSPPKAAARPSPYKY